MNFLDLAAKRQSVRKYLNKAVEREKIDRCIEAARLAPSACNSQPWKFIVVDEPSIKDRVARETFGKVVSFNHFSLEAPVMVVVAMEGSNTNAKLGSMVLGKELGLIDIGIAAEHFCLQAAEEGLGACMLGWLDEKGIKSILNIPKQSRVVLIITLGYPQTDETRPKQRKKIEQIMTYNKY